MPADPVVVALSIARELERLAIPYVIGGLVASTLYGEPRATLDVNFAIRLESAQADELADALENEYYVHRDNVREAAAENRRFNVIQHGLLVKADLYVRPAEGLYAEVIRRARTIQLAEGPGGRAVVATAEDTLLQKLRRYRLGDEVSDRPWRDVLGILKAQGETLDGDYLQRWANELDLADLLARAWSGLGSGPTSV